MFLYKEPDYLAKSIETDSGPVYLTGDRMTTFMIYLSDVARGGWTAFPRLGVAVPPGKLKFAKGSSINPDKMVQNFETIQNLLHATTRHSFIVQILNCSGISISLYIDRKNHIFNMDNMLERSNKVQG